MSPARKHRRGLIALAAAVTATAATAGVMLLTGPGKDASAGKPKGPPTTTEITRTDLVQSKTVEGRLDYAQRRVVKSPVEGTVTKAAESGRTVSLGQRLYERDARPVTLLYGSTPMFRTMKAGARGPDVLQLERNLRDLGFGAGLYVDVRYDEATKAAVKQWQKSLDVTANGEVGQGDVVFQRGPVRVVSADAALADSIGPDSKVLTVASTKPVVRAELEAADGALAAKGTKVEIATPGGDNRRGKVSGVVAPEESESGEGGAAASGGSSGDGIGVEITLDDGTKIQEKDRQGTLQVKFVSESRKDVLTVPVEAIVALREGGYGLELVQGSKTRMVAVETGLTADGRIEVSGAGLAEGMKVGAAEQ
ncbi:peptidoglycan-binding domain-containing protein [Streptomyces tubercidicus]|uniref:peptidoglycan-binding domain-containing protein n=1 Tax=Streptomyces tubercidicus TaxID=47759 RepID=UPI002E10DF96|nr:peptidoglycan-binding protein [Streptomyces tubercidicus]WSX21927.1 peptidoglycan-binding protein [Streptomyces tubercidicus]